MTNQSAQDEHPMAFLLEQHLSFNVPVAGEIRTGHIVETRGSDILVDIGAKSEGIIPSSELDDLGKEIREQLALGEEIDVYIVNPEDHEGNVIVSYAKAAENADWNRAEALLEAGDTHRCRIVGFNRGGLLVQFATLRGFMPKSQISSDRQLGRSPSPQQLQDLIGEPTMVKVIEADRERGRLVLSERAANDQKRNERKRELFSELSVGDVLEGRVVNLTDFGAFVDLGGAAGLVHLSEISWRHIDKPSDVLKPGQEVKVAVMAVDLKRNRITLSMKQLETNPWERIDDIYQVGQLVDVTVTQLANYGAFARINDDYRFDGLVHISELSDGHIRTPDEVVKKGDELTARIIRIDSDAKQIGLSIKQVFSDKFMHLDLASAESEE
jgi:small subunit ribosomal protein S1